MTSDLFRKKDVLAGLLFVGIGALVLFLMRNQPLGDAQRMGPAFFPSMLSGILMVFGLVMIGVAIRDGTEAEDVQPFALRPMVLILGSLVAFALLIEPAGLVVSVAALVGISVVAERTWNFTRMVSIFVALSVISGAIFLYGFNIPHRIWPGGVF